MKLAPFTVLMQLLRDQPLFLREIAESKQIDRKDYFSARLQLPIFCYLWRNYWLNSGLATNVIFWF